MKMKTFFVVTVFIISQLPYSIKAQQNKFDVGIDVGPSFTSLRGSEVIREYQDPMLGYSTGIFVNYNFIKSVSLKTGIYNDLKGCSSKITMTDATGNADAVHKIDNNFQYLTVPLLVKFNFGNKIKFFANAGPYISYLMKSAVEKNPLFNPNASRDQTDSFKRFDGGIAMGIGVSHALTKKVGISFEVRDNLGLKNIDQPVCGFSMIKTNALNCMVGIAMKLGSKNAEEKK